jgi:probable phosphoglycerate mutase
MVTFYLVRHGETDWNVAGRLQGQTDTDLTARGKAQAVLVGKYFSQLKVDKIVSSDLKRCVETAQMIQDSGSVREIQKDPRLRERHLGVIQGLTHEESRVKQPEAWEALSQGLKPEGGESVAELEQRSKGAIFDIVHSCNSGDAVVVVSHGGTLNSMKSIFFEGQPAGLKNCSISTVSYTPQSESWRVETWGDTEHLDAVDSLSEVDRT